jgi:hypothetical protein
MIFFVMAPLASLSAVAALGAGITCLIANSAMRTLLSKSAGPERMAPVMAVWAIAWAGSKPVASLLDGLLAGWIGVHWTGVVLALPALIPIIVMIFAPSLGRRLVGTPARRGRAGLEPVAAYPPAAIGSEVPVAAS